MWTDRIKAVAMIAGIALLVLIYFQRNQKIDVDALAEQVASKVKVDNVNTNFEKFSQIVTAEIGKLKIGETASKTDLEKFKKEMFTSAQFRQYVNEWCSQGVETINRQFDLCLKSREAAEALAENRGQQNEKLKSQVNECIQSLKTVTGEYQKTDTNYQELLKKGKSTVAWGPGGGYDFIKGVWTFGVYVIYIMGEY